MTADWWAGAAVGAAWTAIALLLAVTLGSWLGRRGR